MLRIGIDRGVNGLDIQAFTAEQCKGKGYAAGEECFCDVIVSNPGMVKYLW